MGNNTGKEYASLSNDELVRRAKGFLLPVIHNAQSVAEWKRIVSAAVPPNAIESGDSDAWFTKEHRFRLSEWEPWDLEGLGLDENENLQNEAREWLMRGLRWMIGFHHEMAIVCMRRALVIEPRIPLAFAVVGLCHGPNYNVHQFNGYYEISEQENGFPSQKQAFEASQTALDLKHLVSSEKWQMVIKALAKRIVWPPSESAPELLEQFSSDLRKIWEKFSDDPDIGCLFAESMMQLSPWMLYNVHDDSKALHTDEIRSVLSKCLGEHPQHPGLLHLWTHLIEMSPNPSDAFPLADGLRSIALDLGHLLHMPSHIDMQIGRYKEAVESNSQAIVADMKAVAFAVKNDLLFSLYAGYIAHDFHSLCYVAMHAGLEKIATHQGWALKCFVNKVISEFPHRKADLDMYHVVFVHVAIRFGKWDEILEYPMEKDNESFFATNTTLRYARGLAFAAKGDTESARKEQAAFEKARSSEQVNYRVMHNNSATRMFAVNSRMLEGEILYRGGFLEESFKHLREAIDLEDNLAYDEPPGQMQPVRHALGALLLESGDAIQATEALEQDLKLHPCNVWALRGLASCFKAQNLDENSPKFVAIAQQLEKALAIADTDISKSCACAGILKVSQCTD